MTPPRTHFNPFGLHVSTVTFFKKEMEKIAAKIEQKSNTNIADLTEDVRDYERMCGKLVEIVKDIPAPAMQPLLAEIAVPFATFIDNLGKHNQEELKTVKFNVLIRKISLFIQTVSDRAIEPFNSEVLEEWAPLFKSLITSTHHTLRDYGFLLWKKTFGTIKTALKWPGDLRKILDQVPRKYGIILPPIAKPFSVFMIDGDDAMDGLSSSSVEASENFKLPEKSKGAEKEVLESQSTFQFSQQAEVNEMADKLLKERKAMVDAQKVVTKETTPRRRAPKISLYVDDDSCDYVAITSTPPSSRKTRLTDRQKEKLAEASGPSISINYMGEESQSGCQKTENMKKALTAMNFEVGEDSMSVPFLSTDESPPFQRIRTEDIKIRHSLAQPEIKTPKRSRNLFGDSTLPAIFSNHSGNEDITTSPPCKRDKMGESLAVVSRTGENAGFRKDAELGFLPKIIEDSTPQKTRRGRPKNTPQRSVVTESSDSTSFRRSSRLTVLPKSEKVSNELDVSDDKTNSKLVDITSDVVSMNKLNSDPVDETKSAEISENLIPEQAKNPTLTKGVDNYFAEATPMDDTETCDVQSSPKTPRTPSILRGSKAAEMSSSPMTERKKNRVHFGEESLPKESTSSPLTPRRRPAVEGKPPTRVFPLEESALGTNTTTNSLLEVHSPAFSSAFFPSLIDCSDKIDKILPLLVTLYRKSFLESAKKSLQAVGVSTVGDFATLPKTQIEKFTWIKGRTFGAKNALIQYEKSWNPNQASENVDFEKEEPIEEADFSNKKAPNSVGQFQTSEMHSSQQQIETFQTEEANHYMTSSETIGSIPQAVSIMTEAVVSVVPALKAIPESAKSKMRKIPQMTPETSQFPTSLTSNSTGTSSETPGTPVTLKERSAIISRKNLAPIFMGNEKKIKTEIDFVQQKTENAFLEDARQLHLICVNLTNAHSQNKWPEENSANLLSKINKAAIFFKYLVQTRGSDEWKNIDIEDVPSSEISVEREVENLVAVYKRFSRQHTLSTAGSLPWNCVMDAMNDTACLLESIFIARSN